MVEEATAFDSQGSILETDSAKQATVGTGLLGPQALGLLLQQDRDGALGQASSGGCGDLLHGCQIHTHVRSCFSEGPTSDDFSPVGGQFVDLPEFLCR
jgi:hypothetical protein